MKEHRLHCSAPPPPGKGICKTPTSQKGVRVGGFDGGVPGAGGGIAALLHWLHCCVAALLRSPPAVTGSDLAEWSAVICLGGGGPSISSLWGGHFVCVCVCGGGGGEMAQREGLWGRCPVAIPPRRLALTPVRPLRATVGESPAASAGGSSRCRSAPSRHPTARDGMGTARCCCWVAPAGSGIPADQGRLPLLTGVQPAGNGAALPGAGCMRCRVCAAQ